MKFWRGIPGEKREDDCGWKGRNYCIIVLVLKTPQKSRYYPRPIKTLVKTLRNPENKRDTRRERPFARDHLNLKSSRVWNMYYGCRNTFPLFPEHLGEFLLIGARTRVKNCWIMPLFFVLVCCAQPIEDRCKPERRCADAVLALFGRDFSPLFKQLEYGSVRFFLSPGCGILFRSVWSHTDKTTGCERFYTPQGQ